MSLEYSFQNSLDLGSKCLNDSSIQTERDILRTCCIAVIAWEWDTSAVIDCQLFKLSKEVRGYVQSIEEQSSVYFCILQFSCYSENYRTISTLRWRCTNSECFGLDTCDSPFVFLTPVFLISILPLKTSYWISPRV